jgi:CheY-like chemotaxis protein
MIENRQQVLTAALPYARRFARALSGSQAQGDLLVAQSLRELIMRGEDSLAPHERLYRAICTRAGPAVTPEGSLKGTERKLLLLVMLEEIPIERAAQILDLDPGQAQDMLSHARAVLHNVARTDVLIIEDEPIIAMDIEELVRECGHTVVGVAHTEADAVALALKTRPGLILADINLGMGGDGMSAVARIMRRHEAPVIFVTAYPERLLTGEALEPSFVITKPFDPLMLSIATYQAVSGGLREMP